MGRLECIAMNATNTMMTVDGGFLDSSQKSRQKVCLMELNGDVFDNQGGL